jgi:hypothetical protein
VPVEEFLNQTYKGSNTKKWSTVLQNADPRRQKIKKIMFLKSRDVLSGGLEASSGV